MTECTAFSRLNFGLIDLGGREKRVDGSYGLALDLPAVKVEAERAKKYSVYPNEFTEICNKIVANLSLAQPVRISVAPSVKWHCGLGFGTQLRMAVARALIAEFDLNVSDEDLLRIVDRGGTSNVGYYGFLHGGFCVECGHRNGIDKNGVGPGNKFHCYTCAPLVYRHDFPEWGVCLVTPDDYRPICGETEIAFFDKHCPIDENEIDRLCRYVLMGIMPSVHTGDFDTFCHYLEKSMEHGFRSKEIEFRQPLIHENIEALKKAGFGGIGMTSLGPTVFGFARTAADAESMSKRLQLPKGNTVTLTRARNSGAVCSKV